MILIDLHYTLVLCHSFKGCALPPSLLFHALFLSPIQTHKTASTIFWRDNQKISGLGREILYNISPLLNPLILPNIGHTGDLGDAQTPVRGGHHALTCLGIGLRKVVTPQPVWGSSSPRGPRRSSRLDLPTDPILGRLSPLDLPGDLISRRLSRLSLPGDLHPDPGTPGSQVATVLGRISFRKTHP